VNETDAEFRCPHDRQAPATGDRERRRQPCRWADPLPAGPSLAPRQPRPRDGNPLDKGPSAKGDEGKSDRSQPQGNRRDDAGSTAGELGEDEHYEGDRDETDLDPGQP
jgi:hypothetical protein